MRPAKEYTYNYFQLFMFFVVGLGFTYVYYSMSESKQVDGITTYILFLPLFLAIFHLGFRPIKVFKDHLEYKNNPFKKAKIVNLSGIRGVSTNRDLKLSIRFEKGIVTIPLKYINPKDREDLERYLNKFIKD